MQGFFGKSAKVLSIDRSEGSGPAMGWVSVLGNGESAS
jgi:hypothetical protein